MEPLAAAPDPLSPRNRLVTVAGLGLVAVLYSLHATFYWFLTDDAYIYFRYAKNLVDGAGLAFNPGERVEGYTGLLWLLVLAAFRAAGASPETVAPWAGYAAGLGTLLVAWRAGARLFPGRRAEAYLIAPLALAANRTFAAWSIGGLETALFTFLVALAWHRLAVELREGGRPWSGAWFGLAGLARPEGPLFFALGALVVAGTLIARRRRAGRREIAWVLWAVAPVAAQLLFRLAYFGRALPNTFYAKVPGAWWGMGARYLAAFGLEHGAFLLGPLVLCGALWPPDRRARAAAALVIAVPVPYLAYVAAIGGDHFEYRMLHVLLPWFALAVQEGAWSLAARRARGSGRALAALAVTALALAAETIVPATASTAMPRDAVEYAPSIGASKLGGLGRTPGFSLWFRTYESLYRGLVPHYVGLRVEEHRSFWERQLAQAGRMRRAMRAGMVRPGETIGIGAIGVVPYYAGLVTQDLFGLADPAVARLPVESRTRLAHERVAPLEYVMGKGIDYTAVYVTAFFVSGTSLADAGRGETRYPVYAVPFEGSYFTFISAAPEERLVRRFAERGFPLLRARDGGVVRIE